MEPVSPHTAAARRAILPELLLVPDVALALGVGPSAARKAILRGLCGPYLKLGRRRLAVRRSSFLESLAAREVVPEGVGPPPVPRPKPEYLKLLRRHRAGRGRP